MTLAAGSKLGPYEILAPLGARGMGEVYRARHTRLERTVAIKISAAAAIPHRHREAAEAAVPHHSRRQLDGQPQ